MIVEDLAVGNMLRSRLWSRNMSEQRWAAFDAVLEYKAWKAGIRFEKVNPSNTSTDCSTCGHRQRMPMSARTFECGSCGLVLDRDHNAARNICARGVFPRPKEDEPETRAGHKPVVTRRTNFYQETDPPGETQADVTEPYLRQQATA